MAPKPKLMAIASCDGEGGVCVERKGIISDLPDSLLHHILSFLAITDLIRVCFVSKRWRELSLSAPYLNIDEIPLGFTSTCHDRLQFLTYLERYLFHRGDNKIQRFRMNWERHFMDENGSLCICTNEQYRIISWIKNAVRCEVEELELKMTVYDATEDAQFPSSVLLCGSLRSLEVDMNFTLGMPSFGFYSNLTSLKLKDVSIEDERFFKWISCNCKFIQELDLFQIRAIQTICIESPSLKFFKFVDVLNVSHLSISGVKLEDITLAWNFEARSNVSLNLNAPNLKSLGWSGKLMNHINLGEFRCLKVAVLFLMSEANDLDKLYKVFRSLSNVGVLKLYEATVKAPFSKGSMPAPLHDIRYLSMDIGSLTDNLVPAMASLFRGLPNLYIMCIKCTPPLEDPESNTSLCDLEYWKLQNIAFDQLKMVIIELCNSSNLSNAVDLARYILECAQNLLEMTIIYPPQASETVSRKLKECKIPSGVKVVYQESS